MNKQERLINYAANAGVLHSAGKLPYQKSSNFFGRTVVIVSLFRIYISETIFTPALQVCMLIPNFKKLSKLRLARLSSGTYLVKTGQLLQKLRINLLLSFR
jgi:hypothetical protein